MESLGRLRALAAGAAPVASRPSADGTSGVRATLRGLSLDERDWALLTVSVASSLGLRAGLLIWHDRTFALLETDVALVDALSAIPGLARFQKLLSALGNGGSFCVPLSGRPVPVGKQVVAWSVVDALAALESADPVPQGAWASASAPREPLSVPLAFPYPVPAMSAPFTREAMQAEIESELESAVHWSF
jgi:hypothetical protein